MAKKTTLSSAKRFGVRYGKRNKEKVAFLEKEHRGKRKCPYCNYTTVKRLSRGIWNCEKCNSKFAGKAYTISPSKKTAVAPVKSEETEEPIEEEMLEEELLEDEQEEAENEETAEVHSEKPGVA